ncbi:MAG: ROK family protein [Frankiaceae bacterium]
MTVPSPRARQALTSHRRGTRALAVDIGGTKLAVRVEAPGITWSMREPWTGDSQEQLVAALARARRRLHDRVDRVAIACAPTLDASGRVVAWPSRPSWVGLPLRDLVVTATLAEEIVLADDGTLAALAEAEAVRCADLAYIGIGTGVGGGIVSGGRLLTGCDGTAGEIGHLTVDPLGPACGCGRRGCLQTVVCAAALERRATVLHGRATTTTQLVSAIREGQPWALRVQAEAAGTLATVIMLVDELVRPARIHIGGGLGHALTQLPSSIEQCLAARRRPGRTPPVVAAASAGGDASLAGALLVARRGAMVAGGVQ